MSPVTVTVERWSELLRLSDELWEAVCRDAHGLAPHADDEIATLAWSLREALHSERRRAADVRRRSRSPRL